MTGQMMKGTQAPANQLFAAPQVNTQATVPAEDYEKFLSLLATRGTSSAIFEPQNAWMRHVKGSRIFTYFTGQPGIITPTAGTEPQVASGPWPTKHGQGGALTIVVGSTAPSGYVSSELLKLAVNLWPTTPRPRESHSVNVQPITASLPEFQPVNVQPLAAYRLARSHALQTREDALADVRRRLDKARAAYAQRSPRDVVTELTEELGIGQLLTARAVGVTPTAVRKWRRGDPARPEHRDRLSQLAAWCRVLTEVGVHDPAGWIDIPISNQSTLTPLDLFASGRADLVVLLGSGLSDPDEALDAFDSSWRKRFAPDRDYEVVTLADGSRSVVPRREASG